ncbi:DUF6069 family protein [Glutamicibacter sp. JL.03c]|uniref:DUF6069 family protein n=1 Tax=Glutamicibacter sp. JL.03c TaxID=2984842 RepID=UPI0021F76342|nr:DUF6069 family protein [Glutamicibacter sp. JL.03c]UYQ77421.1 DUF6069 family protein [Glutamicibacter sp. JL.03c]
MTAQGQPNSPFNYIQVVIAALGAGYLNVIIFFIGIASGASMKVGSNPEEIVGFDNILQFTWLPLLVLGLVVFLIGRAKKGVTKVAQWVGLIVAVVSSLAAILSAADAATALTLSLIHIVTGIAWFFAVHYGNKKLHVASKDVVLA